MERVAQLYVNPTILVAILAIGLHNYIVTFKTNGQHGKEQNGTLAMSHEILNYRDVKLLTLSSI